ncbi:MAG: diaminopimelate epimerase [Planctomycetota bacterium]|nr:diaminopimelate epimerase [Planctomycetota bacterium]
MTIVDHPREIVLMQATGNRFAVLDAVRDGPPDDPVAVALELCARERVDGLLIVGAAPPKGGGDCDASMTLYNPDGSRPEACGNGLRCAARLLVERGHVRGTEVRLATDAGPRTVHLLRGADGQAVRATAVMGTPRIVDPAARLEVFGQVLEAVLVDMGNPHCVVFVDDVEVTPVSELGPTLERHARFPERTNVEFVHVRGDELVLRVWERGVGETASCGTGASAAAVAAIRAFRVRSPVAIETRGGRLVVEWHGSGPLVLTGSVERVGVATWP